MGKCAEKKGETEVDDHDPDAPLFLKTYTGSPSFADHLKASCDAAREHDERRPAGSDAGSCADFRMHGVGSLSLFDQALADAGAASSGSAAEGPGPGGKGDPALT